MALLQAIYKRIKPFLPESLRGLLRRFVITLKMLWPHRFEWIVYRAESAPAPDLSDLQIEPVEFSVGLTAQQRAFILRDLTEPALRANLRRYGDGWECVYMTRTEGQYCSYMFCRSVKPYARAIPELDLPGARLIGPGYTAPEFRGRNIHARAMQFAIRDAQQRGFGPFFGLVYPWNKAAISAMAKAGWQRLGVWRGVAALGYRFVSCQRIAD